MEGGRKRKGGRENPDSGYSMIVGQMDRQINSHFIYHILYNKDMGKKPHQYTKVSHF